MEFKIFANECFIFIDTDKKSLTLTKTNGQTYVRTIHVEIYKINHTFQSDKKLVRECIREMQRQRGVKKLSRWEEKRAGLKGRLGINEDWMGRIREQEERKTEGVAESKEKDRGGGRGEQEKKDRRIQVQRTLQGNRDERKAGIPKTEDEKERKEPDSKIQVWQRSQKKTTLERGRK